MDGLPAGEAREGGSVSDEAKRPRHHAALIGGVWRCCCGWVLALVGPEADVVVEKHVGGGGE